MAEWREASSANFVIYADDDEQNIRRFSRQLELYHSALEALTGEDLPAPSPSNRLTIFVVKNDREVRRLMGEGPRRIAGFYRPRAGASIAVVPRVKTGGDHTAFPMIVLLHEYTHHFLISAGASMGPRWYDEGGAEFFASAQFPHAGGISLGGPARHRMGALLHGREVKVRELLDPASFEAGMEKASNAFYARSWLLYHYLTFAEMRQGQMEAYLGLMGKGLGTMKAARQAFGDFDQLDRELKLYLGRPIRSFSFQPGKLGVGSIMVRQLDEAEAAVMPLVMRLRSGVGPDQAAQLVGEVRKIAVLYPQSAPVLSALAEAEVDAGNMRRAIRAADRAIELDPQQRNAYVQKGNALFRQAAQADDRDAAYTAAMAPFMALRRLEKDHPLPLIYNFHNYLERARPPPAEAVQGMERAIRLAPFDQSLRSDLAQYYLKHGKFAEARPHLASIASDPNGGFLSEAARRVVRRIDAGVKGEDAGRQLAALLTSPTFYAQEGAVSAVKEGGE
ncbi:hypothetical protein H0274_12555 [Altererythrobacter sp. CC-YST694]|uniref:DUF1570 domain-containing protein n=1 Tax=Altererythrobacter sp. CC-YST694 TaxID=2755038 RepID=UPI001D00ACD1|nr:DUF1570 domain-containing protein [Altererythrobacter sp. CC-YST694]MCB5426092.1 hypothetical protein [Altererythrobacter sp. CC-YST694]